MIEKPQSQVPAVYHRRIGDIVVTALSDGYADAGIEEIRNIDHEEALKMFAAQLRPARRAAINCFLIHSAGRVALVDTGCGPYFGSTAGHLINNLSAAGLTPAQIDTILLTHIHPDHSAGLTDLSNGGRVFPNAALVMHREELAHWFDDARMAAATEAERSFFFRTGREQVEPYRDRWKPFEGTAEVFPGVKAMPLPGHTPGHTGYLIESQGDRLLIWGDIIHVPEIQIARPEVTMTFDCDQAQAALTRSNLFEDVASSALLVAGMHIDFPGFAHIVRRGAKFHLLPEPWINTLSQ